MYRVPFVLPGTRTEYYSLGIIYNTECCTVCSTAGAYCDSYEVSRGLGCFLYAYFCALLRVGSSVGCVIILIVVGAFLLFLVFRFYFRCPVRFLSHIF